METPNLSQMEEIVCPDCGKPLFAVPSESNSGRYQFVGCNCNKEVYELPDCIMAGLAGGPMFFYKEKPQVN